MINQILNDERKKKQAWAEYMTKTPPTPQNFWSKVTEMVKYMWQFHPEDMILAENEAKLQRDLSFNKFSESKEESFRVLSVIPDRLRLMIFALYGDRMPFDSAKTFELELVKRFPKFAAANKY